MSVVRPRLGELLLARGTCSRDQLREAWEQRVLYGDRLGTNLLALGHIDEATLSKALGEQHGVHAGHGAVIRVDKETLKLVSRQTAEKRHVVPHHVVDRSLYLLMRDPQDATAIDDAQFSSGLRVVPVVVVEARMWQLLEAHYGVRGSLRPIAFERTRRPAPATEADRSALGPELTSEEDFQLLYAGMHSSPSSPELVAPELVAPVPSGEIDEITATFGSHKTTSAAPASLGGFLMPPKSKVDAEGSDWREEIEHTNPMMMRPKGGAVSTDQDTATFPLIELEPTEATDTFPERQQTLDFVIDVGEVVDETPLSFADASRLLKAAADRNAIGRIVLRAARSTFKRACLLSVFPDRFVGWLGIGEGFEQDRMKDIVVPRNDRSVFGLVAESRSHYIGPLQKWPLHGPWVKATGRKIPSSAAVFPILVRGRAVNLLVVDNGHGEHVGTELGEVLILAQQIALTYESLLKTG